MNPTTGVVSISGAAPVGTHTITIRATDNCNLTTDSTFTLTVTATNQPPTIAAVGVTRQAGSPVSNSTIANVTDDGGNGAVVVTVTTANPSNGVTISNIVNTNGVITANVVAACGATTATFTLQASDGTLTTTTTLTVTVTANSAPTLSYSNASVATGGATTVNPLTGPSDNGSVSTIAVQSQGTFTGTVMVNNTTGIVSISNAGPVGTHTITIRATDNCMTTTDATFTVTVSGGDVTAPVISYTLIPNESVNPTLSVTITDAVGVTSATIFFKINGAAVYSSNACTGTAGSTNSVWNCPITGTASGQAISYYVAAADAAGNIGYNPTTNAMAPNLYTIGAATVPSGTYSNITLSSNTSFGGGITVNKVLTLNGVVDMGANTLTLGCNATVSGGGGGNYVIGNLAKQYCATGTFIYPVGTTPNGSRQLGNSSEYSPFTAVITAIGTVPSTLTVSVTDAFLPGSSVTQSASRYWNVLETGDLTANISFTYLDPLDVTGTETNYQVLRREGVTTAVFAGGSVNAATNTATAPGVTNFSQWAAGVLDPSAAPVEVGGRVRQPNGRGIFRARIVLQDSNGDVRTAYTNPFGYYRFTDVQVGETYIFTVWHRRYQFVSPTQVHSFVEDDHGINFVSSGETVNFRPEATFFDHAPFDFDGDGRTDVAVYRNTDHYWYIKRSSDNTLLSQTFGAAGDRLVPADYDGDGRTDIAVFRPSNGVWYIWLSASNALRVENFGTASDQPIPSDFDGDGKADVSVWNELKGIWQVKLSSNGATVTERFANGRGDFIPLASDRDGDGKADFIFFNQADGTWKFRLSESRTEVEEHFGQFGDRALMGDFDGDGRGDLAIYRGGENAWSIKLADGGELKAVVFGENADAQATGDFDGDGRTDLTNFKNGVWSIRQSINGIVREQRFGLASDTVIPSPFNR